MNICVRGSRPRSSEQESEVEQEYVYILCTCPHSYTGIDGKEYLYVRGCGCTRLQVDKPHGNVTDTVDTVSSKPSARGFSMMVVNTVSREMK